MLFATHTANIDNLGVSRECVEMCPILFPLWIATFRCI